LIGAYDTLATAQRLKILFKNSHEDTGCDVFFNFIDFPVNLMRNYTIPAGSMDNWDRTKMAIVPITISYAFCFLMGLINDTDEDM